jgi:putative peptidoglycan lipid II flippase
MVLVTQIGGLVQTAVASTAASARTSTEAVASVAAAAIAWLIFMLPHSVVTVSIATAYFTRMSQHAAAKDMANFKMDLTTGLRVIALVSVISTAVLIILSYPIARVFAGEYPATVALGNVVAAFMIGLVPFSFVYMMQRAFFALEDTRTPFVFTSIQIAIHITGSLILGATVEKQWLVVSIALLTAFSVTIQGIIAYLLLKRRIGGLEGFGVGRSLMLFILAMLPAAFIGVVVLDQLGGITEGSYPLDRVVTAVASGILVGLAMLLTYLGLLWLFKAPELREVSKQLRARFGRKSK